ncbi:hypothetical protein [Lapidilactobacillus luobeiensis]|uniref:hypothetical protein n=1 Tax=Lapidilactobacillus luobeiensis TaxID=2950371 RepID=UPI0021C3799A|nr:hypothetical protein [Lapidilactobacillus luobeiensis]
MALTKIFSGMEKGPEAIDSNFANLNTGKQTALADTGWVKLSTTNAVGNLYARKFGNLVNIVGTVHFTATVVPSKAVDFFTIPATMYSIQDDGQYRFFSAFSPTTDTRCRFQIKKDKTRMIILLSNAVADEFAINFFWQTA